MRIGALVASLGMLIAAASGRLLQPVVDRGGNAVQEPIQEEFQELQELAQVDPKTAVAQLKEAAHEIKAKFVAEEQSKTFGLGLRKKLVNKMADESMQFWEFLEHIDELENVDEWSEEDAKDLQVLIAQVAQMDDDMGDPKTVQRAKEEFSTIVKEFEEAGLATKDDEADML